MVEKLALLSDRAIALHFKVDEPDCKSDAFFDSRLTFQTYPLFIPPSNFPTLFRTFEPQIDRNYPTFRYIKTQHNWTLKIFQVLVTKVRATRFLPVSWIEKESSFKEEKTDQLTERGEKMSGEDESPRFVMDLQRNSRCSDDQFSLPLLLRYNVCVF